MKKKILTFAAVAAMALASGAYADEESSSSEEAVSSSSSEETVSSSSVEMVCFQDSVTATTIDGKDTTVLTDGYKSFEIKTLDGKKIACIDAMSRARFQTISIPDEVTVDSLVYNRVFKVSTYATVVFPVNLTINTNIFSKFYEFGGLMKYWSGGDWVIQFKELASSNLVANTPYIILPQEQNLNADGSLILRKSGDGFTLKTSSDNLTSVVPSDDAVYSSNWQFRGTYEYKKWTAESSDLGRVYGLATKDIQKTNGTDSIKAGQFVKGTSGVSIAPMRAYLYYNRVSALTKTAADSSTEILSDEDLPEVIIVRYLDAEGNITAIGEMNTRTGNVTMDKDVWFDMKGRKFNKKPTVKGTYYNQGNKVIIK